MHTEDSENTHAQMKTVSAPTIPLNTIEAHVTPQTSAPSSLHCLKENNAPPFAKPEPEEKPQLLIGTVMKETEAVEMIAAAADRNKGLEKYLVEKKILANHQLSEKKFLISFIKETIDYAAQRDFNAFKLACLLTIYAKTHLYFKRSYWLPPINVWTYFKEIMIRHTVEDSPHGQEVFEPEECYDIMSHFHTVYLTNLPLVHILTFGTYRLKLTWPFKPQ